MYKSFDRNNTSVKFYKYRTLQQWGKDKLKLLPSKDLLILDWKLDTNEPRYRSTLSIIDSAIKTENILC